MTQNQPHSQNQTICFGQNRPKPLFSAKIDEAQFFRPKLNEISFSGQKPVFPAKINQNKFFRPKPIKTTFFSLKPVFFSPELKQTPLLWSKLSFSSQNRPKLGFLVKIDQRPFFFGQNPVFESKNNQNHFFRPKLTKNSFSGQNQPKPSKTLPLQLGPTTQS